ncbi:MAG: glycosyltransferase family 4 protein [Candidatus Yanofskybacteria bacterium]|nr:glycosyltransferase family 4 protein [Candidatus Yanofskybacteria bacterium]
MKLLYIANLRLPTEKAYGIQIVKMCEAFALQGYDVVLAHPFRSNDIGDNVFSYYSVRRNFEVKRIWAPDFYFSGRFDKIAVNIKGIISALILCFYAITHKTDVIYSRDEWPLYFLSFLKNNLFFEAHRFSGLRSVFYKRFLRKKIKIVTISKNIKNRFLDAGFKDTDVLVAHDGVDLDSFDVGISKEGARNMVGLPQDARIVMYTGHLFPWKGADILGQAAKLVPESTFVFVGGTSVDIENFRNKFGQVKNILILGHKPYKDVPFFLKAADILVLPNSAKEKISVYTSPLKLFEYMASGRTIVASNLPSIREVLSENNSVLVEPDNPEELVREIRSIFSDPSLKNGLAKKAFEDVKNYTWERRAEKIREFI